MMLFALNLVDKNWGEKTEVLLAVKLVMYILTDYSAAHDISSANSDAKRL